MGNRKVRTLFNNSHLVSPKVSIVLLDWSCRESFHTLDYLQNQTAARDQYEIVWIEYFNRQASEIEKKLRRCELSGKPAVVNQWVLLEVPQNVYFHKHLMYNTGIFLSRGRIVVVCDSDAIVPETFVQTIIDSFEKNPNLVLHLDQVRNNDRRFYPFNYPSIEAVTGDGSINWKDGKTTGLWDMEDILHSRNYGACMAALREDLIAIGGADEHVDYLGHICGPYEMTFRLVNYGKKEVWHPTEFLYHVWHPGQAGENNYLGPHDGKHMSTTALGARRTGRKLPLVENPAIKQLRLHGGSNADPSLVTQLISPERLKGWSVEQLKKNQRLVWRKWLSPTGGFRQRRLSKALFKMAAKQFWIKLTKVPRQLKSPRVFLRKAVNAGYFLRNIQQHNRYIAQQSQLILEDLTEHGTTQISLYGTGDIAELLHGLTADMPLKIQSVYDDFGDKVFLGFEVQRVTESVKNTGTILIAAMVGIDEKVERLMKLGVERDKIVTLQ
jgi:hypothetical protein